MANRPSGGRYRALLLPYHAENNMLKPRFLVQPIETAGTARKR
jgi:hypothetical protein